MNTQLLRRSILFSFLLLLFVTTAYAQSATFDFEANVTGARSSSQPGSKNMSHTKGVYTLNMASVRREFWQTDFSGVVLVGSNSIATDYGDYESSVSFSLAGGQSFTLAGMQFADVADAGETIVITTSKGVVNYVIPSFTALASQNFTSSDSKLQGITSFTITSTDGQYYLAFDEIVLNNITATNTTPLATNLTQSKTATEGGSAVALDDIVVTDPDAGETITATLTLSSAAAGSLSTGTFGSATSTYNAGTGVWTVTGSVANVNSALAAVALTPSANNDQNFTITTRIRDAANTGPADGTISVTVTAVNDAPNATNLTQSKTATEGGSAVALDDIVVTDPDTGETITATLTMSSAVAGSLSTGTFGSATSTYSAGTGVWTVTGSVANVNSALAAVAFTPSANNDQNFTIATRIRDAANTGPADGTISVTVTAVNDAPTLSGGPYILTSTTIGTDSQEISVSDLLAALTYSDPDAGALKGIIVTGVSEAGHWQFKSGGSSDWINAAHRPVSATNGVLLGATDLIFYTPGSTTETATLTFRAWDQTAFTPASVPGNVKLADPSVNGGTSSFSSGTATISITVNAAPVAPVASNMTQSKTATEGGSAVALDDIVVTDPDAGETITATLTLSSTAAGTLSTGTFGSATSIYNTGTGIWTVTGSVADVNAALAAVAFTPSANNDQNFTISTRIRDAANTGPADGTISFTVTGVNDAPTATNLTQSKSATEGGSAVALDDIVVTDSDTGETITATLTLSSTAAGTLSTGTFGSATSTFNAGTGVWTVSGSVADVNAALAAVAFTPSANNDQNFTISTRIRDAANTGPADGTISFTVTGVNDAPTATNLTQSKSATEGGSAVALDDIVVTDSDTGETITATLTLSSTAAGSLSTGTFGSATSTYSAGTGVWTVSGSVADVNAALAAVAFTPSANNDQNFTISTRIRDAANTGPADGTISFTVTGANDAPTATNLTQSKSATEGGSAVALDDIVVTDSDTGETITATLTLSSTAAGTLSTGTFGSATSTYSAGTGVWTVSGSIADVNAALAAVAFTPSANNDQNFTISTRIRDAANTGPADGTISFTVTGANDAPTATNLTQSKTATEGGSAVALDDIVVTDSDTGETITATLTLSSTAAGTLSTGTFGSATSTFNAGTGVWTVSGSVADVNAALAAVAFTPSANSDQNFTITTRIRDAASTGPADGTISFTVTAVNDAPTDIVLSATAINENVPANSTVGTLSTIDPDAGNTFTYTLVGGSGDTDNGAFNISGSSLRITNSPDFETKASYSIRVRSTDQGSLNFEKTFIITINDLTELVISPSSLPAATVAGSYSQTITVSGGSAPYSYGVTSGSLPAGLSLSSTTGTLAGTPTAGGNFNFNVTVTDNASVTGVRSYSLTVNAPVITVTPASLPAATAGAAYSQSITATGGTAGYTYAVTAGALPAGLTLAANGTLSGTATAGGTFNFTATATDSSGGSGPYTGSTAYTLTVNAAAIALAPASLPAAAVAAAYSQTITATGGTAGYTYAVTAGALPAGITLAANGSLSGTATAGGTYNFTVTATDSSTGTGPYTGSRAYTLTVNAPTISLAPATLPAAAVATAYSQTITASGGTSTYTYTITAGALPAGLTLAANGTLSGTATAGGTFNFTVTATDSSTGTGPYSGSRAYSLTVSTPTLVVAPATLPAAAIGAAYSQGITASGGTSAYSYAVTAGALPAGLTLAADGTLSGTATAGGTFSFTITATDSSTGTGPYSGSRVYSLTVNAATISLAPATLPAAAIGTAYSQNISASGGTAGYTYAVTAGALPAGLTLSANGTVSGTATTGGTFNFTVTATDSSTGSGPYTGSRAYSLVVGAATIAVAPATLAATTVGATYNQSISASGGTAPYTYAITTGALPAGLSLSANGTLSGTATAGGSFSFTITATDSSTGSGPYSGSRAYTLAVNAPVVTLAPATLAAATVGVAYSQNISASGGTATYSYSVTAGALPPGISLTSNGTLSGTPTAGGTFNFTLTATDSSTGAGPYSGSRAYSLAVSQGAQTITFAAAASVTYGSADFDPGATSDNSTIPITYSSSDHSVATIVGNKVHIVKAGTVTIHADQASNSSYHAAARKSQTLSIQPKNITLSLNASPAITKVYDGTVSASLAAGNYALNGVLTGDAVSVSGTASYDNKNAGSGKTITGTSFALSGPQKDNYVLTTTTASTTGTVTQRPLTITADDKSKIQGQPLPAFTASYAGFVAGESSAVLITQPTLSTTATAASPQGTYPIAVSGATAQNYSITFVPGMLTVTPGSPTSISLAGQTILENAPASTPAGTLSSTSDDPAATFNYALVSGTGDADNHLFTISGNRVLTVASLDYEAKSSYSIRVKSTTQYGLSLEEVFNIALTDVNEAPTLAAIGNQVFCLDLATRTINLSGITAGPESGQNLSLSVSSDNPAIFDQLSVGPLSGNTAVLSYRMLGAGSARVTVTVKDSGGTASGGSDTFTRSFDLTANVVPGPSITSDLGLTISKGATATLTATGGGTYQWAAAQGIVGGTNSAVLTVRPTQTTTYQVTVTLASGCTGTASVTVTVKEDYQAVDANNFMSPDGDGVNDRLVIKNLDMYPNNEVKIYDRAGRLLYTKKNYTNEWDGTFQGVPLADDTYYYVVDFGPGRLQLKGFVTIVRAK